MNRIPLRFGALKADGYTIVRSSLRWLRESGQFCRAGQPVAYCNISLEPSGVRIAAGASMAGELEMQVAFAPRVSGRLTVQDDMARGGYLAIRGVDTWDPNTILGHIEPDGEVQDDDPGRLRLLMLAGRRMTALADVHAGLLSGWFGRSRAWWHEDGETPVTLLSMGVCDAAGVVLGEQSAFLEMFEAERRSSQFVFVPDHPVAPCTPILIDQLSRTPAQFDAIAEDLRRFLGSGAVAPTADDWMFAGALLSVLQNAPLKDRYTVFGADGSTRLGPPDAVLLSLSVEPQAILRHRTLGYPLHVIRHHLAAAGPAIRAWIAGSFESVRRPVDAIRRDYETLIDTLAATTRSRVMVLNRMSTSGYEDISSYLAFDAPLSDTLSNIAAKEWNLMLHDVAESRDLTIIDVDALGAELGGGMHLPDGIHQSGQMAVALRQEILQALSETRPVGTPAALVR
ncbi:conserved hypothetical protein [Gluconacetobacter diazotrophicus PA1 5]|uniref:hypothetical protein n=1 Tax=Gluconacetobacter diazotrophicus TaxID=33996 RepID=UPI000173AF34|nr:hypothetical protein [Gluconacetobacter diazotrophicus]ACI50541.1 conserved hypothetical protein [Gluconacetobacter diazotrophicus PA1 5]TWB09373.1 hypothetical protein FBZ86_10435 [Gluconacetobacter diazotrophicus]